MADSDEEKRKEALKRLRALRGKAESTNAAPEGTADDATGKPRAAPAPGPFTQGGGLRNRLGQGGGGGAGGRIGQGGGGGLGGELRARLAARKAGNPAGAGSDAAPAGGLGGGQGGGLGGGALRARLAQAGQGGGGGGLRARLGQAGGAGGGLRARLAQGAGGLGAGGLGAGGLGAGGLGAGGLGAGRVEPAAAGQSDTVENKHATRTLLRDRIARLQAQLAALDAELDGVEDATIIEDGTGGGGR